MPTKINFFTEDVEFTLKHKTIIRQWIEGIIKSKGQSLEEINYIFCSDEYLLNVNKEYLDHDYYTDIITFDNREDSSEAILSDIFVSIDRVKDNAITINSPFDQELHRILIHGVLHLLGQGDKTDEQQQAMRKSEEACLSLLQIPKK